MIAWSEAGLWSAAFANILLIGLQGRNINTGNYVKGAVIAFALNNTQFIYIHAAVGYSHLAFTAIVGSASVIGICEFIATFGPSRAQIPLRMRDLVSEWTSRWR